MTVRQTCRFDLAVVPTPEGVRVGRQFAASSLDAVAPAIRDVVVLIVSELVSNAVRHARSDDPSSRVEVRLDLQSDRIRVEVQDAGGGSPAVGEQVLGAPAGRGLILVDSLATQWGCTPSSIGKTVWAEVEL